MNEKRLTETITEDGISWINFFNGRLLSGEDLSREQDSNLEGRRRLGRAIGEGIAYGLEVSIAKGVNTRESPQVEVEAGLALNRQGQSLSLGSRTRVRLARPVNAESVDFSGSAFDDCKPLQPGTYVAEAGVYLLTIAPARSSQGRATVSGLDNILARCNTHHTVEGVQFRLIQLGLSSHELEDTARLRNIIAYRCFGFGNPQAQPFFTNPFDPSTKARSLLDELRPRLLTDCDVPLAIINWTTLDGIKFVDMWAVRRRLTAPQAATTWGAATGDARSSLTEAMVWQFADQIKDLREGSSSLESLTAKGRFKYLPPLGLLPVSRQNFDGVIVNDFFSGFAHREPEFVDGVILRSLFEQASEHEPIDLSRGEMVWLYKCWQNELVFRRSGNVQPYVIFTSAWMPYLAAARFDASRWDFSNYARCETC
ncbi:MAG TPA: hypothetical protein VGB17_18810 [Pyrinomonadaceae bacterium]|jgi:hypothetical protein